MTGGTQRVTLQYLFVTHRYRVVFGHISELAGKRTRRGKMQKVFESLIVPANVKWYTVTLTQATQCPSRCTEKSRSDVDSDSASAENIYQKARLKFVWEDIDIGIDNDQWHTFKLVPYLSNKEAKIIVLEYPSNYLTIIPQKTCGDS